MEPIPLWSLTVLLNYESMASDPRFEGLRLLQSTTADPTMIQRIMARYSSYLKNEPITIQ